MGVVDSVLFSQLIINFKACLEKIFKQLELFRSLVERGHRCRQRLWQFGISFNIVMEICRNVVICQLLKVQQNLICFNRRGGIRSAKLRMTDRAVPFLLSSRCTRGAVSDVFVNSCHHVKAVANLF